MYTLSHWLTIEVTLEHFQKVLFLKQESQQLCVCLGNASYEKLQVDTKTENQILSFLSLSFYHYLLTYHEGEEGGGSQVGACAG